LGATSYRNQRATERTISALKAGGKLEHVDDAAVGLARHLAAALDHVDPAANPSQTASLARAHLAVLRTLRGLDGPSAEPGFDLAALLRTPVGDEANT
jgi:hypothetical protein